MRQAPSGPTASAHSPEGEFGSASRLQQIVEAQRAIAVADLDLKSVMALICERTQALTNADAAAVLLPEGRIFRYGAATGYISDQVGNVLTMKSLSGWAFLNNESAWSSDTLADPRVNARAVRDHTMHSMIVVPLRHGSEAIGLLQVSATRPHAFTEEDVQTLDLLSVALSAAMSHASEFEALSRFRTVFDGAPIGLARLSVEEARIVEVNAALADMLGYEPDELVGMRSAEITEPEDLDDSVVRFRELVEGKLDSYRFEKRYVHKNDERIWCQVTATALDRDTDGKPSFVIAMIENVTERKHAELALQESNERLAAIVETQAEIAAAGLDVEAATQLVVERSLALTGADSTVVLVLEGDELVTNAVTGRSALRPGSRLPVDKAATSEAIRAGRPLLITDPDDPRLYRALADEEGVTSLAAAPLFRGGKADGAIVAVTTSESNVLDEGDVRTLDLLAVVLSAAKSRAAEVEAERRQVETLSRFETLYRDSPVGIGLLGLDRRWVEVNQAMCDITGRTAEELVVMTPAEYTHPEDATGTATEWLRLVAGEIDSYRLEARYLRKDGSGVWAFSSLSILRDARGEPQFVLVMSQDVTQRKQAEIALAEHSERLARIVATQSEIAAAELDRTSVMQLLAERAREITGADSAMVNVLEGDEIVVVAATGSAHELEGHRRPLAETLTAHALALGEAILVEHTKGERRLYSKFAKRLGDGSHVCVPLFRGGVALGSLTVSSGESSKRLTERDRQTLELLAVVLSAAVGRASEFEALARFEAVYEGAPIGIGVLSLDGRIVQANENMLAITGHGAEHLATHPVVAYTHPDDVSQVMDEWSGMMRGEYDSFRVESRMIRKDGTIVWSASAISLVRDADGKPLFAIDMAQDVTDRKLAEFALQENGERLARIVETQNEAAGVGTDIDKVVDVTLARTLELTRAQGASISFLEDRQLVTRASRGSAVERPGDRRLLADSVVGAAAASGGALLIADSQNDPRLDRDLVAQTGERSRLCVPIFRGEQLVGALNAHTAAEDEPVDEEDLHTAELLGLVLSSALGRAGELEVLTRFETIFRDAPIAIGILSLSGKVVQANEPLCALTGYDAAQLAKMLMRDYIHAEDREAAVEAFLTLAAGDCEGDSCRVESRIVRADGGLVWTHASLSLVRDPEGKPLFAIDMIQDVTEQKLAALALHENTDRLTRVLETQTQISAAGLDLDGVMRLIVERSQSLTRAQGAMVDLLEGDELVTRAAVGIAAGTVGNRRPASESLDALEDGLTVVIERAEDDPRLYRPLTDALGVRSLVCVPLFKGGRAVGALTVAGDSDVDRLGEEDRQTLELLAVVLSSAVSRAGEFEALARFEAIYQSAPIGIGLLNLDGALVDANAALRGILGAYDDRPVSEMTYPDDVPEMRTKFRALVRGEIESYRHEARHYGTDGQLAWVDSTVSLLRDSDGRPQFALTMSENVTERRAAEEQLRQSQKIEAIGQLSAGIAHDFNNLLMGVLGYAGLARGEVEQQSRAADYLDRIEKTAHRAATLTKQLLAFGRRQTLQPRALDLNELVAETVAMLERVLGEQVEIVPRLDPLLPSLRADPTQLQQVLFNLSLNARDAMPDGGTLTMETTTVDVDEEGLPGLELTPGHYVVLCVSDTGIGMPTEVLDRIFEPFFTTKGVGEGTGLGLPSVYGIVKQSRGDIEVASEVGDGSTFRIYLPAVEEQRRTSPTVDGETPRVLLVEDADVVRELVTMLLEEHGYDVVVAKDPTDAVRLAQEGPQFDVLLTDLVLSRTSGAHLAARIQEHQPTVRVLYMSAYEPDHKIDRAALIPKPFANEELLEKLEGLLSHEAGV